MLRELGLEHVEQQLAVSAGRKYRMYSCAALSGLARITARAKKSEWKKERP